MLKRITAQDISADLAVGEHSVSELDDALTNDVEVELDSNQEFIDVNSA